MPMLRQAKAFLLLTILGAAPTSAAHFARHAVTLTDVYGSSRPMTVAAPDNHTRAIVRFSQGKTVESGGRLMVFLGGDDHDFAGGPKAELLWAPDSRAIAVTADDGNGFVLSILVHKAKGHRWRQIDLTDRVARLFAPQMRCDGDGTPNIGAVGWTSGQRLIVAAQVPPHSRCRARVHLATYVVDAKTGEVLMEVDPRALRRRYRRLLGMAFSGRAKHRRHRPHQGGKA